MQLKAVIVVILAGLAGIYLGAMLHLEGYLGIVFAIAAAAWFVLRKLEEIRFATTRLAESYMEQVRNETK